MDNNNNSEVLRALKKLSDFENRRQIENETAVYKPYAQPEQKRFVLTRQILWDLFNKHKPAEYQINERNQDVVYLVLRYFSGDPNFDKKGMVLNKTSLDKGILLSGTFGIGKTILFETIQKIGKDLSIKYGYNALWFKSISAGAFVQDYMQAATSKESTFTLEHYYKAKLYIDDLGFEDKAFNKNEIFEKLFFERHKAQMSERSKPEHERKIKTFVSTNLKPSEISDRYGDRIGDRLGEMFNIINWNGTSWR